MYIAFKWSLSLKNPNKNLTSNKNLFIPRSNLIGDLLKLELMLKLHPTLKAEAKIHF